MVKTHTRNSPDLGNNSEGMGVYLREKDTPVTENPEKGQFCQRLKIKVTSVSKKSVLFFKGHFCQPKLYFRKNVSKKDTSVTLCTYLTLTKH